MSEKSRYQFTLFTKPWPKKSLPELARIDMSKGYHLCVDEIHREYDRLMPVLEKHNVALGVQNHYG